MALSDPALASQAPLSAAELADAEALVREAGWNQTAADWRIFLDLGRVLAVRNSAGRVVATAAMLPYGGRFAWISMVLVAAAYRRQGLARRLLQHCVAELAAAGLVPVLDATPAGRAVYLGLDFHDTWGFHRWEAPRRERGDAPPAAPDGITIRPLGEADWSELCALDARAFGADRSAVLARLRARLPAVALVARRGERRVGFLLGRDGRNAAQLGPLIATDEDAARALLAHAVAIAEAPLYVDLADGRSRISDWLSAQGFAVQRPFTRMVHGRRQGFDDPAHIVAVAGPELG